MDDSSAKVEDCGESIEFEDVMVGAVALEREQAVLTGNAEHFERIDGLAVETY